MFTTYYISLEPNLFTHIDQAIERQVKGVSFFQVKGVKSFDEVDTSANLVIYNVTASQTDAESLVALTEKKTALPVLFVTRQESELKVSQSLYQSNWYYDVVSVEHLHGLALRAANLARIYDHLREVARYQEELGALKSKVETIEQRLEEVLYGR